MTVLLNAHDAEHVLGEQLDGIDVGVLVEHLGTYWILDLVEDVLSVVDEEVHTDEVRVEIVDDDLEVSLNLLGEVDELCLGSE